MSSNKSAVLLPVRLVAAGQIALTLCLFTCIAIVPHYFFARDQGGMSNYGTESRTVWLFSAGFGLASLSLVLAASKLNQKSANAVKLRMYLYSGAVLYMLVLLSTFFYKAAPSLRNTHQVASIILFVYMLVTANWLKSTLQMNAHIQLAYKVLLGGLALGVLTLLGLVHVLSIVELGCGMVFGYILTIGVNALQQKPRSASFK